jgi:hypothetical protein
MRTFAAAAVGLLILSSPSAAHHANAIFDAGKRITVTGCAVDGQGRIA